MISKQHPRARDVAKLLDQATHVMTQRISFDVRRRAAFRLFYCFCFSGRGETPKEEERLPEDRIGGDLPGVIDATGGATKVSAIRRA